MLRMVPLPAKPRGGELPALPSVQQFVVGQHQRDHRFDHRRAADGDAGIVTALAADARGRFEGDAHPDRLAGRDAAVDAADTHALGILAAPQACRRETLADLLSLMQ